MIKYLKTCWKQVATVVGVLAIITSIITFYATLAKTEDLKKLDVKVNATSQKVKEIIIQQNVLKLNSISEQMVKTRYLMKSYPKDKEIKEDYKTLQKEKEKAQQDLDNSLKQ